MGVVAYAFSPNSAIFVSVLLLLGHHQSQMKIETAILIQQVELLNQRVELLTQQVNETKQD